MERAYEIDFINKISEKFRRSPLQKNKTHHTDAEIIDLNVGLGRYLAITTDTISEEIKFGLYDDPFLIGWMTVMANMSDIAAVGASPLGILISESFPGNINQEYISKIQEGIEQACKVCNTFVFGGDISSSDQLSLTGCAFGILDGKTYLSRVGCKPGDLIYSTGRLGRGNAFALQKINGFADGIIRYQPVARLTEGKNLLGFANCCMDTSDGFIATIDQLMRLNNCGFRVEAKNNELFHPDALKIANSFNISPMLMLAGIHGEFELLYTIPESKNSDFLNSAKNNGQLPIKVGRVIKEKKLFIDNYSLKSEIDSTRIRNVFFEFGNDISRCTAELNQIFNDPN